MGIFDRFRRRESQGGEPNNQGGGMPPQQGGGMPNYMPGEIPNGYMTQPGMAEMARMQQAPAPIGPAMMIEKSTRTPEQEEAYRTGERMGVEQFLSTNGLMLSPEQKLSDRKMNAARIHEAAITLLKYKAGKVSVDNRIIRAQEWWKLRNWEMQEEERRTKGAQLRKPSTAWLWNCIVGKHADAIDSFPEPVILPRMEDDKEEAKVLSEIVPIVMQMNGFEEIYNDCSWQKMQEGTGAYGCFWDAQKLNGLGDISLKKINMLNLFWEPGVTDIQESKNIFFVTQVDNDILEQQYPQLKGQLRSNRLLALEYRTDDYVNKDDKSAVVDWYYFTWIGQKKVLQYCKFVDEIVLYSSEEDPAISEEGWYSDARYPFVLDPLFPVEGSPAGYGYIDIGKDAQMDIDTLNQAMVLNAVANATPRHFIRKDGGVNEKEFSDYSKPFVHVNASLGEDSIRKIDTMSMGTEAFSMLQQKIDELKFITGNTDVNNGGVPTGVTAASAIAALKEDSGRSSKDSTKAAYRAYSQLVDMVIERIRQFYDLPRQFRIIGENGEEEFRYFTNEGMKPQPIAGGMGLEEGVRLPVFDIEVRAQRENAYTRMSQNELALDLLNRGFFEPQRADISLVALDMMDFKGKDSLITKIKQNGTMLDALTKVGQIAMQLAQDYAPEIANELAMTLQGVMTDVGGGGNLVQQETSSGTHAVDTADETREANPDENALVKHARERAQAASRPD